MIKTRRFCIRPRSSVRAGPVLLLRRSQTSFKGSAIFCVATLTPCSAGSVTRAPRALLCKCGNCVRSESSSPRGIYRITGLPWYFCLPACVLYFASFRKSPLVFQSYSLGKYSSLSPTEFICPLFRFYCCRIGGTVRLCTSIAVSNGFNGISGRPRTSAISFLPFRRTASGLSERTFLVG